MSLQKKKRKIRGKKTSHSISKNSQLKSFVVAGQVKAGKSSFLNALLGEEVLPSDVLQATSALIKVFHSKKVFVEVKYGNGSFKKFFDNLSTPDINEAAEYLKKIGSVQEEFRELPINQLNNLLLNRIRGNKENLDNLNITALLKENKINNLYNLNTEKFTSKVKKYLRENINLSRIPVVVALGYPLPFSDFNYVMIDTPGINAMGGIEDITYDFVRYADSIIFIQPLEAIESKTLKEFVEDTMSSGKIEKNPFMVLTHSSFHDKNDCKRLFDEAKKIFSKIPKSNFFVVDSLTEIFVQKLYNAKNDNQFMNILSCSKAKKVLAPFWLGSESKQHFLDLAQEAAGFKKLRKSLIKLSK